MSTITRLKWVCPLRWKRPISHLSLVIALLVIVTFTAKNVNASAEYSALGTPKCDPPGKFRTEEKLDFDGSKKNGATVGSNGFSFIRTNQLADCANWCCKLPAVNCSIATLEIKPSGANCHLLICYPAELCVFSHASDHLSYDRTLFVPHEVYNVTSAGDSLSNKKKNEDSIEESVNDNAPTLTFTDQFVPPAQNSDPQHDSAIKPRKGVELPTVEGSNEGQNGSMASKNINTEPTVEELPKATKRKTPVGAIFLYAAIILGVLVLLAFLGQKFLDCWEHRHYTRADYLLDGMYEDREDLKRGSPSGH